VPFLVIIGATPEGKKELIGLTDGVRESAQSWKELLLDLKRRGLSMGPELAVADGALGFWKAVEEVWPQTRGQRCWVHKTANVLNKLPKSQQSKAKRALQEIWMAETHLTLDTPPEWPMPIKELGVSLGHRLKILAAINELGGPTPAAPGLTVVTAEPKPQDSAERPQVTVIFSDLIGSTALSARMDPEDLREVISAYQKCVAETVHRFGGFVACRRSPRSGRSRRPERCRSV
jgi:Transposase, Mutator family